MYWLLATLADFPFRIQRLSGRQQNAKEAATYWRCDDRKMPVLFINETLVAEINHLVAEINHPWISIKYPK